ncbi:MAG TPA: hypothetical protein DCY35_00780 [Prolixibacteraceae bacterium]|nr:hypothetical protein [Prolixibacteraceae bacterium]
MDSRSLILKTSIKRRIQNNIWSFFWDNFQLPDVPIMDIIDTFREYEPTILENICLPPYLGDSNFQDYSVLISLIKALQPSKVLELGTAHGNTVANICVESAAQVFTVNALPQQIDGNIITFNLNKEEIGKVYRATGFQDRVIQIYENTRNIDILNYVNPKSIDFAIIDACHDMDFVVNDFQKISPALSDRAVVLFHDTVPVYEHWYLDSYLGCMYLRRQGFNIKHIRQSSWGYWSAMDPYYPEKPLIKFDRNIYLFFESIIWGDQETRIKSLRWLASGFLRGKFD